MRHEIFATISRRSIAFLLATSSFVAITPAIAQDASADPAPQAGAARPASNEEIVVTARRKAEGLTEVPASITAYSSEFLQNQNIQSFADYATKIPNLTFQYGGGSDYASTGFSGGRTTTIRGVAGLNTTAYYINDTPVPSSVSPQVLDLERIEVLKGPQGTLFGASSMGGNLRFITSSPSLTENRYTVQAQVGKTRDAGTDVDANALASVVLVPDQVSLKAAFGYTRDSGFISRRFPDGSGQLVTKGGQGRSEVYAGSLALRVKLADDLEATLSGIGQWSELNGYPAAYVPLPGYKPVSYTLDRDRDIQEYSKDRWALGSFVLNYTGSGMSVVSSTSYFARKVNEQEDITEGTNQFITETYGVDIGNPAFFSQAAVENRRFTHETRLSFDEGTVLPNLSGIFGIFYQHQFNSFGQRPIVFPALQESGLFEPGNIASGRYPSHEDNVALFGELYYEVVPKLTLTLGLRQYWIKQKSDEVAINDFFTEPGGEVIPRIKNKQSGLIPKAVISYKIGRQGNVYASVGKGFRVGGTQAPLPDICSSDLADIGLTREDALRYKPDKLWSYEIGAKNSFANGRLNVSAAGFQIDWSHIQQSVFLPTCTFGFVSNAGKARIRGGELEVSGRPFADIPLTIQLGLGYTDGVLRDPGLIPQDANTRLVQVPKWTGTIAGHYETELSDGIGMFIGADYSYTGSVKVANSAGGFLNRQAFNIVNGNIGITFGRSKLMIYGKNLLDKRLNYGDLYPAGFERQEMLENGSFQRLPRAAVSRPRQIGVQYRVDF
ncbi:TonB-dependent receptor [Sphingobium cloacae]|uniref:TonB-dependent receptor plug n=1 Tax=Sphingobium cloacae TaxID=120107 RepID=A0A1E1F1R3_9SPHN|nr:TonB-dependent receptor [Sphingobium cloacae]BAV64459.1 TonB-dependent receptor plug [Sphingobium cloacae]